MIFRLLMAVFTRNECYNLCGKEVVTLCDVVEKISNILDIPANIETNGSEPVYLQGNGNKLKELIKYEPKITLGAGLKTTIEP